MKTCSAKAKVQAGLKLSKSWHRPVSVPGRLMWMFMLVFDLRLGSLLNLFAETLIDSPKHCWKVSLDVLLYGR
jgi:hypothetical protein